ncbi:MAG: hypothetical protein MRK02_10890 [Candidatus Scalindua sp.]|nr:hypothetical protein [Candidatus Scalindua sp.]
MEDKKISDMTGRELRELIRDTVLEVIDPDYGLELRSEVEESLKDSIQDKEAGKGITLDAAKKELGIE